MRSCVWEGKKSRRQQGEWMNNLEERRIRIGIKRKVIPKNELEISDEAMGSERRLSNGI